MYKRQDLNYHCITGLKERKALEESIVEEIHESETEMDVEDVKEEIVL